jgi:hypothetical protein
MHLTEKQKGWLNAAMIATSREGPVFRRATLRAWLSLPLEESSAIAQFLQREGLVVLLPDDEAILTDKGRQATAPKDDAPPAAQDDPDDVPHALGGSRARWVLGVDRTCVPDVLTPPGAPPRSPGSGRE